MVNEKLYKAFMSKKSSVICAKRLGIGVSEYKKLKKEHNNSKKHNVSENEKDHYISVLQDKVIEFSENIENGTAKIKGVATYEPKSAEDIQSLLKIDCSKWKLSTYWNKEHKDIKGGSYWVISAMVSKIKESDITIEQMEDILSKVFSKEKYTEYKPLKSISNKKALFIYTSDKHIAASVDGNVAMYPNNYDNMSFAMRLKTVLFEVNYLKSIYGKFEDVFIIDLGDRMDGLNGYTTRGGHKLPQNMSNKKAFETAIECEKEFYDGVIRSDIGNNYKVINNANSNHGGDFDYMVSRALEIYLNLAYPKVTTSIQEKFIDHLAYGRHVILFTHGKDDADMKHGLPLHLNDKTENYINKYLMYNNINPKDKIVSLVKGDLHVDNSQTCYSFRYRNVLSLFGGSKWIGTNFGPTHPGCSFDIIEKETDRIFEHKILFK